MESKKKRKKKTVQDKPPKKQMGIDMKHIPASLKMEGYEEDDPVTEKAKVEKIPETLFCPICKELFVNPEMYPCGHTLCKLCILGSEEKNRCPVCRIRMDYNQSLIPNYVLKNLIEQQYPDTNKHRSAQIEEMMALCKKMRIYDGSVRRVDVTREIMTFVQTDKYVTLVDIMKNLSKSKLDPPVCEKEAQYNLAQQVLINRQVILVGKYFVWGERTEMRALVTWLEKNKAPIHKKWTPLLLMASSKWINGIEFADFKKLATIFKIDIGNEEPSMEQWKSQPPLWLKDIPLEIDNFMAFHLMNAEEEYYSSDYDDSSDDMF